MAQNVVMFIGFMPGRGTFFNKQYFKDLQELKKDHIKRFSDQQTPFSSVLLCLLYSVVIFGSNLHYNWVRSNFAIWVVFLTFPWLLSLVNALADRSPSPSRP